MSSLANVKSIRIVAIRKMANLRLFVAWTTNLLNNYGLARYNNEKFINKLRSVFLTVIFNILCYTIFMHL